MSLFRYWVATAQQHRSQSQAPYCISQFDGDISELTDILASVIRGSAIGLAFLLVTSDLQPVHGNVLWGAFF